MDFLIIYGIVGGFVGLIYSLLNEKILNNKPEMYGYVLIFIIWPITIILISYGFLQNFKKL
jgi:hypothetical protein